MTAFKMKKVAATVMFAAFFVSSHSMAATETTLKVTGSIAPAACTPTLSGNGEVAYDSISSSVINSAPAGNSLVQLGAKDVTLDIKCDALSTVGFNIADNRAATAVDLSSTAFLVKGSVNEKDMTFNGYQFGLGTASNNAKIGAYSILMLEENLTADGVAAKILYSDNNGQTWLDAPVDSVMKNDQSRLHTIWDNVTKAPKLAKDISIPLRITTGVQTKSVLGGDAITLDGNATVSLVYL